MKRLFIGAFFVSIMASSQAGLGAEFSVLPYDVTAKYSGIVTNVRVNGCTGLTSCIALETLPADHLIQSGTQISISFFAPQGTLLNAPSPGLVDCGGFAFTNDPALTMCSINSPQFETVIANPATGQEFMADSASGFGDGVNPVYYSGPSGPFDTLTELQSFINTNFHVAGFALQSVNSAIVYDELSGHFESLVPVCEPDCVPLSILQVGDVHAMYINYFQPLFYRDIGGLLSKVGSYELNAEISGEWTISTNKTSEEVPEPSTFALFGLGLLASNRFKRRCLK